MTVLLSVDKWANGDSVTPTWLCVERMIDKVSNECCKAPVVERILKQIYLYVDSCLVHA